MTDKESLNKALEIVKSEGYAVNEPAEESVDYPTFRAKDGSTHPMIRLNGNVTNGGIQFGVGKAGLIVRNYKKIKEFYEKNK